MVDVTAQPGVILHLTAQVVHVGIVKVLGFGQAQHLLALGIGQELAIVVQQLEGVPLLGVVGCGDDDATTGMLTHHSKFGCGGCGKADVDHIKAHTHEGTDYGIEHHTARQTGVTSDNDNIGLDGRIAAHKRGIGRSEFDDIEGREAIASLAADGASYSRN